MAAAELTPKGAATRQAIMDVARTILLKEGYPRLAMREVAHRCGIKLGNLQYYFATRDALLTAVIQQEADKDIATIKAAMAEGKLALRVTVAELVGRWRGESGIVFTTLNLLMQHDPAYRALYQRIYKNFHTAIEEAIRSEAPDLSAKECALRARLLTALIDGAAMQPGVARDTGFRERLIDEALRIAGTQ